MTTMMLASGAAAFLRSGTIAQAQPLAAIRLGCGNVEATPQAYFAADAGLFQKSGIDARLSVMRGGAAQVAALIGGDLDAAEASSVVFGSAVVRGLPLVAIAPGILWDPQFPSAALVTAPSSRIRRGSDLNGKIVGVTALAALGVLGVEGFTEAGGGDRSTVKFVEISAPALTEAVVSGRVDAAVIEEPALSAALLAKRVRFVTGALSSIGPSFVENVWFVRADWLKQNRDVAARLSNAIISAGMWAEANRGLSERVMRKYAETDSGPNTERYGHVLDPTLIQPAWNAAYKYKLFPTLPNAADYCWNGRS